MWLVSQGFIISSDMLYNKLKTYGVRIAGVMHKFGTEHYYIFINLRI